MLLIWALMPIFATIMEEVMQYIWKFRLWPVGSLRTVDGQRVDVIDAGNINTGSGPDFFNAKVNIDGRIWAGNIEIHVRATDWYRHGHQDDPAYDNVILHVVSVDDGTVRRRLDNTELPQIIMPGIETFRTKLNQLISNPLADVPCASHLPEVPDIYLKDWMTSLAIERLESKSDSVFKILDAHHGDWRFAIFVTLARGLGFGTNSDAMEQLARSVPLDVVLRHSDDVRAMEAILLGIGDLINLDYPRDDYERALGREWTFYSTKFNLNPGSRPLWRSRLRPGNHPARRLALLASMLRDSFSLCSRIINIDDSQNPRSLFDIEVSDYWRTHTAPGVTSPGLSASLSGSSRELMAINVVAPVLYAYGTAIGDNSRREAAIDVLMSLRAEHNSIIAPLQKAGLECRNAFASQALLQLRKNYCLARKCMFCRFGHRLLSKAII